MLVILLIFIIKYILIKYNNNSIYTCACTRVIEILILVKNKLFIEKEFSNGNNL
jgi:hypothetical protein